MPKIYGLPNAEPTENGEQARPPKAQTQRA